MRLTVGPLPAAVYWRRRAVVAVALVLVIILFATMCGGPNQGKPNADPSPSGSSLVIEPSTSGSLPGGTGSVPTSATGDPGSTGGPGGAGDGSANGATGAGSGDDGTTGGGGAGPPVVATVPCTDAEIALTVQVSPSPGVYGGVITLTLIVRNIADHACLRDVGSAPQELQVRQGAMVVWSSDHCDTPQASDVRAFGPNIESRFSRRWNTYRVAPQECDPPPGGLPAARGTYQVVARLADKLSDPVTFEIR